MFLRGYDLPLGKRTCLMAVINVTPDSFSDGGRYTNAAQAAEHAVRLAEEGADIIDIGGESSRPGAERVDADEEIRRVIPVIKALSKKIKTPISIDTCKSEVARCAISEGASIVNDITALRGDAGMAGLIAETGVSVILMHMKGDPQTMQDNPEYGDIMKEISAYLAESIYLAETAGIDPDRIAVDPGIGFGKKVGHNLEILKRLGELKSLGKPILVGTSRKSFIGALTGRAAGERVFGTAASVAVAIMNGADMVRVHDVGEMRDVAQVADAIKAGK